MAKDKVYTLDDAAQWFLDHSSGKVTCVDGNREQDVECYPHAIKFFKQL